MIRAVLTFSKRNIYIFPYYMERANWFVSSDGFICCEHKYIEGQLNSTNYVHISTEFLNFSNRSTSATRPITLRK